MLALTIYEDGMHDCGYPIHVCQNPESDGDFHLPETRTQCHAQAAVELKQKDKNFEPEPGEIIKVVNTRDASDPLPPMPSLRLDARA